MGTAQDSGAVFRKHGTAASESSFKRVLERAGLTEPRRRRVRAAQAGRLWSGQRAQAPNEVWTVDFKGWWYDVEGRRCEPLTVRDEHSRYILDAAITDARTVTVRACFERLLNGRDYQEPSVVTTAAPLRMCEGCWD